MGEYNWGPHFIVPSEVFKTYSGIVKLRERFDDDLLSKELEELGLGGSVERVANPWYYRKKGSGTWIKIGESEDRGENFPVTWDTSEVVNGKYEVLGMMHVFIRKNGSHHAIARQNVVEITIEN